METPQPAVNSTTTPPPEQQPELRQSVTVNLYPGKVLEIGGGRFRIHRIGQKLMVLEPLPGTHIQVVPPEYASLIPAAAKDGPHQHKEAFMLMTYRADDGETEIVWNSRDGVTPFVIGRRSKPKAPEGMKGRALGEWMARNSAMKHVDWQNDVYAPNHTLRPGDRFFAGPENEPTLCRMGQ